MIGLRYKNDFNVRLNLAPRHEENFGKPKDCGGAQSPMVLFQSYNSDVTGS